MKGIAKGFVNHLRPVRLQQRIRASSRFAGLLPTCQQQAAWAGLLHTVLLRQVEQQFQESEVKHRQ
jgi:hypothetical protein